ncbi:MAG: TerB family tellurite resistance protein [Haliea sp.]|jgi:uncharacterized tellurite resistance protein B-like protein|nr:TerB family tellurite resistance protein [Haliea sp.]
MIRSLKSLFAKQPVEDESTLQHRLQLAKAALLIEMSRADYVVEPSEQRTLTVVLHAALGLEREEILELIELAGQTADKANSLSELTLLINEHYDPEQKLLLLQSMWRVALVDGHLDEYEERLIRQVADLLNVSEADYLRMKAIAES